ncbi:MAG: hypothetical protein LBU89_11975 [Fibromonadaceae bacterium]|nr:hypothetical protein [Fibromonadaceae bacterium]
MSDKLYVPVTLRALLMGRPPDTNCFADISHDFSRLPFSVLGEYVPSQLAVHRDMEKGAHLHWSLPDALTKGDLNQDTGEFNYPSIPNRWLLTRLWTEDDENIKTMSFLIESDAVSKERSESRGNLGSPSIPDEDVYGSFLYLGRSYRYGRIVPDTKYLKSKLTAVLPANPAYTAFYPDCRNVLGFYDDMRDEKGKVIENAKVTYALAGWFEEWDDDPIAMLTSDKFDETLKELGWKMMPNETLSTIPKALVCHAILTSIAWKGPDAKYGLNIPSTDMSVAIGNSSTEALAAILVGYLENKKCKAEEVAITETMLNHLLSGAPKELLTQDGIAKSEAALYEARFGSDSLVRSFSLKWSAETANDTLKDDEERRAIPQPSDALAALLKAYNHALEIQVARRMNLETEQEELHDTWFKWKRKKIDDSKFKKLLETSCNKINSQRDEINFIQEILDNFNVPNAPFGDNLKDAALAEGFVLAEGSAGRFWAPNPPVLLISQISVDKSRGRDGQYSKDELLQVRNAVISELTISSDVNPAKYEYNLNVQEFLIPVPPSCPAEVVLLIREAALLGHSFAELFAVKVLRAENSSLSKNDNDIKALANIIRGLQSIPITVSAQTCDGKYLENSAQIGFDAPLPEKTAVEYYTQPWFPLYMDWKIDYYPDENVINSKPNISNWRRMGLDMTFKTSVGSEISLVNAVAVSGRTFLTSHAGQSLSERLGELGAGIPNADSISVLSQTLPELHEQLMMRSMQMVPVGRYDDDTDIQNKMFAALDGYDPSFPLFGSLFSPIRAGFFKLRSVSLIDSFGQLLEKSSLTCSMSESMRLKDTVYASEVMLPPRLLQPSRLNFYFRNEDERDALCGWILPNFFDNNITVFSAAGQALGTLQAVKKGEKNVLEFKLPPEHGGRAEKIDPSETDVLGIDKDLAGFLSALQKRSYDDFLELMTAINSALAATNPKSATQFNSLAFFLGRPLALIRAAVSIETLGPPRKYRSYSDESATYHDVDISELEISARLGFRHRHGDGLFGFFMENDFSKIHFTGQYKPQKGSEYILRSTGKGGEKTDCVTVKPNTPPVNLILLMDPMSDVHVTTGILPIKAIRMDPVRVQAAMRNLYHFIFVAPVIQDAEALSLPIFPVEGKQWAWCEFNKDGKFEADTAPIKNSDRARFSGFNAFLREGWLILKNAYDKENNSHA